MDFLYKNSIHKWFYFGKLLAVNDRPCVFLYRPENHCWTALGWTSGVFYARPHLSYCCQAWASHSLRNCSGHTETISITDSNTHTQLIYPEVFNGTKRTADDDSNVTHPVFPSSSWSQSRCRFQWICSDIYLQATLGRCYRSRTHLWSRGKERFKGAE